MQKPIQRRSPVAPSSSKPAEASKANPLRDNLRGMDFAEGEAALSPVQAKSMGESTKDVHEAAKHGASGGGGQLPFMDKIQKSFGAHDISSVKAHTGAKAQEGASAMGASAYASGSDVVFGQSPDLHTAAHEAAHIVQQRAGVSLSGGVGKSGDAYEQQADAVADKVVRGESAEGMLGKGGGAAGTAVQRDEDERLKTNRAYIVITGPEIESHGPDILSKGAASIEAKFKESVTVDYEHACKGQFPELGENDIIYLIAHGDDPKDNAMPKFGEKTPQQLVSVLSAILGQLPSRKDSRFSGAIILEGCHSAVTPYNGETGGALLKGRSMLGSLQTAIQETNLKRRMTPETELVGYRGAQFDDTGSIYGCVDPESPHERQALGLKKRENKTIHAEDAVRRIRVGQHTT